MCKKQSYFESNLDKVQLREKHLASIMHKYLILLGILFVMPSQARQLQSPDTFPLWAQGAPDAQGSEDHDVPTLTVYQPATGVATGTAVIVCPGGGYGHLAMDHEGHEVAKWLNTLGITAFILKYRHSPAYRHPTPLRDAQRAIRLVRAKAPEWHVDPEKVGIMGFSAGGHLAASTGTHFDWQDELATDEIGQLSARPDFYDFSISRDIDDRSVYASGFS